jgi:predicted outer membrane repeat protein
MRRIWIKSFLLVALLHGLSWPTIINIPADYPTIQQGIDASVDGDTVLVLPGTYVENINFNGHNIVLGSHFLTTGDTSFISQTVIDGDTAGTVVTFESHEGTSAKLTGFTIQNGSAQDGGGIVCLNQSHPTISRNIIRNNSAHSPHGDGGGIYCIGSNPTIENNYIHSNRARFGGGIFSDQSYFTARNNLLLNNFAGFEGGGIHFNRSDAFIYNCTIGGNFGVAVSLWNNSSPTFTNCLIWGNENGDLHVSAPSAPQISYSVIGYGNHDGNIDSYDPLFVDAHNFNYNVCAQSRCIDSGDPNIIDPDSTRSDVGYYFANHPACFNGDTWYVAVTGNDTTGNGSHANPFRTIQHAINSALHGDTVIVENGTYFESITIRAKSIVLSSNYVFSGDTTDISSTAIDGDSTYRVASIYFGDKTNVVTGLTICNGYNHSGGGIYCTMTNTRILDNIIRNNTADVFGGAIYCYRSKLLVSGNLIFENGTESYPNSKGGGIFYSYSYMKLIENIFKSNYSNGSGGAINASTLAENYNNILENNIFSNNSAEKLGGALDLRNVDIKSTNNIFFNNSSGSKGGAVHGHYSNSSFTNDIFWGNTSFEGSQLYYDLIDPDVSYCNIQGGWPGGGIIDTPPLFRDPANYDFHLMSTDCGDQYDSPCIDAGDRNILDEVLDCSRGLGNIRSDMGAYGGVYFAGECTYITGDANRDWTVNGLDVVFMVEYLKDGLAPPTLCECPPHGLLMAAADVNASCSVNGLDVTYLMAYFNGGFELVNCEDCPQVIPEINTGILNAWNELSK